MVHINTLSVATLALYTTSVAALPVLDPVLNLFGWGHRGHEYKYSTLTLTSSIQGVFPTQNQPGPTGTQVAALPTGTAFPSGFLSKRKVDGFWDPAGFVGPTGTGNYPAPTGGAFPGFKQGDIGVHDKASKGKHSGSKKNSGRPKKHRRPQGIAQPTAPGSFPAPTGSISDAAFDSSAAGIQKRQFGGVRQADFRPHWGGSPARDDFPTPTATGAAFPTGTGISPPFPIGTGI